MSKSSELKKLAEPFGNIDIEWRIGQQGENNGKVWAKVLAYVSARAIMHRLDDVCGPEGWKVSYRFEGNSGVMALLSIKVNDEWITKEDGAEQTEVESFKGGISSALKRAGSAWGIGRYLYDLEAGFADVSNENKNGYRWAQTKEKKTYYWAPPQLPGWALPKDKKGAEPLAHGGTGLVPEQPRPEDMAPEVEDFMMPTFAVQFKGKRISECLLSEVWAYINSKNKMISAKTVAKPVSWDGFVNQVNEYTKKNQEKQ